MRLRSLSNALFSLLTVSDGEALRKYSVLYPLSVFPEMVSFNEILYSVLYVGIENLSNCFPQSVFRDMFALNAPDELRKLGFKISGNHK